MISMIVKIINFVNCYHGLIYMPAYAHKLSVVDSEVMSQTLETILTKYAIGTSPLVRQASCVWLLTVLKLAGKHPDIQVSHEQSLPSLMCSY